MRKSSLSPHSLDLSTTRQRFTSFSKRLQLSKRPKSSSNRQQYQKMMKTMYVMSNIQRAVKQNDITFLIGQKRPKLRTECSNDLDLQKMLHGTLIDAKRKYDDMKRQSQEKFKYTQKLKVIVKNISRQENQLKKKLSNCRNKSISSGAFLEDISQIIEYKQMDKSVLEHMRERLKQDIHFYQKRIVIKKRNLSFLIFNLKTMKVQTQNLKQQKGNASSLLQKLKINVSEENEDRSSHLFDLQNMVYEKQLNQRNEKLRLQYEQQQTMKAMLAKNSQQKSWEALLNVHLFLKRMLENKMNNEMEKFKIIENAFIQIKSGTEVKDAQTLLNRFLNREKIYGELLSEVTKTKQRHNELKSQYQQLAMQNQKLMQINEQLLNKQYSWVTSSKAPLKNIQMLNNKIKQINTMKIKINQWLLNMIYKIKQSDKRYGDLNIKTERKQDNAKLFKIFLQYLDDLLIRAQFKSQPQQKYNQFQLTSPIQNQSYISTNAKTKLDMKTSKIFNPIQTDGFPKYQANEIDLEGYKTQEQVATIQYQRQQIHQTNQKFMKDMRIKFIEAKKLRMDKQLANMGKRNQ